MSEPEQLDLLDWLAAQPPTGFAALAGRGGPGGRGAAVPVGHDTLRAGLPAPAACSSTSGWARSALIARACSPYTWVSATGL